MNLKVNCSLLAETEAELRTLAIRIKSVSDEMSDVRHALLNSGETFRREAWLTAGKREALEREMRQMYSLAEAMERLIELYADCERRQQEVPSFRSSTAVRAELLRRGANTVYIGNEQVSQTFDALIRPLIGIL